MKKNAVLLLEYDGSRYGGWQRQKGEDNTIQGKLETVLEKMTGTFQEVHGSGRTDAGVHALGQVANVHLDTELSEEEVAAYLNHYLPDDIRVLEIKWAKERFHSRLWAREKTYTYWVETGTKSPVFQRRYLYALGEPLDRKAMEQAAGLLCGTHDFSSFCTDRNKKKSAVRTLKRIEIHSHGSRLEFVMTGDGFLYNMVRILVGTLIEVGQGKREPRSVPEILEAKDRRAAGFTAPARGLFLKEVTYETELFEGIRR
ncbi:MAG: tRNA pseudouridine(38-40) synthase TruA [Hungatella sp.]|nr:tRNA pseudouridine(38-40) synthase TruA [Hungatella sp.]